MGFFNFLRFFGIFFWDFSGILGIFGLPALTQILVGAPDKHREGQINLKKIGIWGNLWGGGH